MDHKVTIDSRHENNEINQICLNYLFKRYRVLKNDVNFNVYFINLTVHN